MPNWARPASLANQTSLLELHDSVLEFIIGRSGEFTLMETLRCWLELQSSNFGLRKDCRVGGAEQPSLLEYLDSVINAKLLLGSYPTPL